MMLRCLSATQISHSLLVIITALLLFIPPYVNAATEADVIQAEKVTSSSLKYSTGSDPVNADRMTQLAVGLFIVLLCIIALAWVARRFNRLHSTPDGALQVLSGLSMGARERIVLVQVGNKQLLLGIAPGRINTLHVLDESLESVSGISAQSKTGFAGKLTAALSRNHSQEQ